MKDNQIFMGKVLHRCGECGRFRTTEDCLMCDCKFNQWVLGTRVAAHAGGIVQVICGPDKAREAARLRQQRLRSTRKLEKLKGDKAPEAALGKRGRVVDSSKQAADLYFDLPAKQRLWERVMVDCRRLLGKSMRGYTDAKFLNMDPFLLADRMDSAGSDSARQWVSLALQLPGDFPATVAQSFSRLIGQHQLAPFFESAHRSFYGEE